MKFFNAAAGLYLASVALAAPAEIESRQGATVVGSVDAAVSALAPTLPQYVSAIESSVASIKNAVSVNAQVVIQAEGAINANLAAIVSSFNSTVNTITAVTVNAAGGVVAAATGLVQSDIDELQADIVIVENIVANLNATIFASASLEAAVQATYQAELTALKNLIQPFLNPIILFAQTAVAVTAGASVTGLAAATVGLQAIANNFYQSLGLPPV